MHRDDKGRDAVDRAGDKFGAWYQDFSQEQFDKSLSKSSSLEAPSQSYSSSSEGGSLNCGLVMVVFIVLGMIAFTAIGINDRIPVENPSLYISTGSMASIAPNGVFVPEPLVLLPDHVTARAKLPTSLTFDRHTAGHHLVLVRAGTEQAVIAATRGNAGAMVQNEDVIAMTENTKAGRTTISIPPLSRGEYTYLCTLPGHYEQGMRGTLTVK